MQSSHADLHAGLYAGSEYTQLAEYAQARVDGCMNTAYRVCGGLSGWMHVHSLQSMRRLEGWMHVYSVQSMRRLEWVDACTQPAEYAETLPVRRWLRIGLCCWRDPYDASSPMDNPG